MKLKKVLPSTLEWIKSVGGVFAAIIIVTSLFLSLLFATVFSDLVSKTNFAKNEIATKTVRAPRDFLVKETEFEKAQRRTKAVSRSERVFTIASKDSEAISIEIGDLYSTYKDLQKSFTKESLKKEFEKRSGVKFSASEWRALKDSPNWVEIAERVSQLTAPVLKSGLVLNKRPIINILSNSGRAVLVDTTRGTESELNSSAQLYDYRDAHALVDDSIPPGGYGNGAAFDSVVLKLARSMLKPNVVFDNEQTVKRLKDSENSVEDFFYEIKRGEVIVRAGDKITAEQERRLSELRGLKFTKNYFQTGLGYFLISCITLSLLFVFITMGWPQYKINPIDLSLICITLFGSFLLVKLFSFIAIALSNSFYNFDPSTFSLATPLAAGGILLQVTLGAPSVIFFLVAFSLLSVVFFENTMLSIFLIALGNIVAAHSVRSCSKRAVFIWAGIRIAAFNLLLVTSFFCLEVDYDMSEKVSRMLWAVVGGLFSGVLGAGLIPIAEFFGRYVTDIKLLELASLDHPLLRELSVGAPGTWNHSTVMGQMAEAGAESCGANPLLARVGAYYHDIGKTKKPAYFVENQKGENRHDKLTPSMSALIIKAHVKDGIEMAEQQRLPQILIDFIAQHHGTSLIEYFHKKAEKEAEEGEEVDESHYRYPGPKPQSKEAGILMLADTIEASSRTLSDPSPAKIQGLVQKMINKIFASGELDQSNLTLKDLHLIAKSFTRVLSSIHHRRVEYSEPAEKGKEKENKESEKSSKEKSKLKLVEDAKSKSKDKEKEKETLKRLGI